MADTTIPASERGRAVVTRIGFQTDKDTIAGAWQPVRFYDLTSGMDRPLAQDDQLGVALQNARDAGLARLGLPGGSLRRVAPLNLAEIGWWLSLGMGRANPTGSGSNYVHVFTSGAGPKDLATLVQGWASGDWSWDLGVALSAFTIRAQKGENPGRIDMTLIGLADADNQSAAPAGTVAAAYGADQSFSDWRWRALIDDVLVGDALGLDLTCDFGVERVQGMSGDEWPTMQHFGDTKVSGSFRLYGRAASIRDLGLAGTASKLTLAATHPDDPTNRLIQFDMLNTQYSKPQRSVSGPGMMSADFSFMSSQDASNAQLTVTLKNGVSTYSLAS